MLFRSDKPDPAKAEDAKARLQELLESAPKPADTHAKMFAVLTDAQKPVLQKELDRLKKEVEDRQMAPKARKKVEGRLGKDGKEPGAGAPDAGPITSIDDPRIPERMRERLKNMRPEDRQQALERLKERFRAGEGGDRGKPAPSTKEDVNVPSPGSKPDK